MLTIKTNSKTFVKQFKNSFDRGFQYASAKAVNSAVIGRRNRGSVRSGLSARVASDLNAVKRAVQRGIKVKRRANVARRTNAELDLSGVPLNLADLKRTRYMKRQKGLRATFGKKTFHVKGGFILNRATQGGKSKLAARALDKSKQAAGRRLEWLNAPSVGGHAFTSHQTWMEKDYRNRYDKELNNYLKYGREFRGRRIF